MLSLPCGVGEERLHAVRSVVAAVGVGVERLKTARSVVAAGGVGVERLETDRDVVRAGTGRGRLVGVERRITDGDVATIPNRVVVAVRLGVKRPAAECYVLTRRRVAVQRVETERRVIPPRWYSIKESRNHRRRYHRRWCLGRARRIRGQNCSFRRYWRTGQTILPPCCPKPPVLLARAR